VAKAADFNDGLVVMLESAVGGGLPAMSGETEDRRLALGSARRRNQRYIMKAVNERLTRASPTVMPVIVVVESPFLGIGCDVDSAVGDTVGAADVGPAAADATGTDIECDIRAVAWEDCVDVAVPVCLSEACQLICTRGAQKSTLPLMLSSSSFTFPFSHVPAWSRPSRVDETAR